MNPFNIELTEEEQERYNELKELSLRHYPKLSTDSTAANMAEYLYIHYAKHNCLPDPTEKQPSQDDLISLPRIISYKTPSDAGETLIRELETQAEP